MMYITDYQCGNKRRGIRYYMKILVKAEENIREKLRDEEEIKLYEEMVKTLDEMEKFIKKETIKTIRPMYKHSPREILYKTKRLNNRNNNHRARKENNTYKPKNT